MASSKDEAPKREHDTKAPRIVRSQRSKVSPRAGSCGRGAVTTQRCLQEGKRQPQPPPSPDTTRIFHPASQHTLSHTTACIDKPTKLHHQPPAAPDTHIAVDPHTSCTAAAPPPHRDHHQPTRELSEPRPPSPAPRGVGERSRTKTCHRQNTAADHHGRRQAPQRGGADGHRRGARSHVDGCRRELPYPAARRPRGHRAAQPSMPPPPNAANNPGPPPRHPRSRSTPTRRTSCPRTRPASPLQQLRTAHSATSPRRRQTRTRPARP